MSQKKFKDMYIPEPCHEDWEKMTVQEQGRFCGSCKKVVYDFTKMNEREYNDFISQKGEVCGQFYETQLNQSLRFELANRPKVSLWKRLYKAAIALTFLKLGWSTTAVAQNEVSKTSFGNTISLRFEDNKVGSNPENVIKGVVSEMGRDAIVDNVVVILFDKKGNKIAETTTDIMGAYSFKLDQKISSRDSYKVEFSKETFKTSFLKVTYFSTELNVTKKNRDKANIEMKVKRVRSKKRPQKLKGKIRCR